MRFLYLMLTICALNCSQSIAQDSGRYKQEKPVKSNGVKLAILTDGTIINFEHLTDLIPVRNQVISIQIQQQDLTRVPEELNQFSKLELIDLSHNRISEIDTAFFKRFSKLNKLYINNNAIPKNKLTTIEKGLSRVTVIHSGNQFN